MRTDRSPGEEETPAGKFSRKIGIQDLERESSCSRKERNLLTINEFTLDK